MPFYIKATPIPETDEYELAESIIIEGVEILAGYRWNGASIPRILWPIIGSPFAPKFMGPSLGHDFLYEHGAKLGYTREQVDELFKKLLIANSVSDELADTIFLGVRAGGRSHWNKNK